MCVTDFQFVRVDLSYIKPSDSTFWRGNLTTNEDRDDKRSTCFLSAFRGLIELTLKFQSNYFAMLTVSRKNPLVS